MKDNAVIAAGHRVSGNISAAEDLAIFGRVEGRIQSEATVVVEGSAIIEGDITAAYVVVRGLVVGDIAGVEGVEVAPGAQVAGDIRTRRLTLRAGGRVAGTVSTGVEVAGVATGLARGVQASGAWASSATAPAPAWSSPRVSSPMPIAAPAPAPAPMPASSAASAPAATTPAPAPAPSGPGPLFSGWPSDEAVENAARSEPAREGP